MNLWQISATELGWLRSLGRKFLGLHAPRLAGAVLAFIAGQAFLLLAMLLPLKVVLLAASPAVPAYLTPLITAANRDAFIILLSAAAIASYGLYHLCERVVAGLARAGGAGVLARAGKLHLFANQEDLAEQAYLRFVRVAGSALIVLGGFGLGLWLNATVFGALLAALALEYLLIAGLLRASSAPGRRLAGAFERNLGGSVGVLSSLNFLLAFALLIVQFLSLEGLGFLLALLSIILARQLLQRLALAIQDVGYLSRNRLRLKTLLDSATHHLPLPDRYHEQFLDRFRPERRAQWLPPALEAAVGRPCLAPGSRWLDSGRAGAARLAVRDGEDSWLLKVYGRRQAVPAAQEAELFASHPAEIGCAPAFLGASVYEDLRLLVFRADREIAPLAPETEGFRQLALEQMLRLWCLVPAPGLVTTWRRTHSTILDRLDAFDFSELAIAADTAAERETVAALGEAWPALRDRAVGLPLVLHNPSLLQTQHWVQDAAGAPVCIEWGRWSIQPVGCEPALLGLGDARLRQLLDAAGVADSLPEPAVLRFVAALAALEEALRRKNLRRALAVAADLVSEREAIGAATPGRVAASG